MKFVTFTDTQCPVINLQKELNVDVVHHQEIPEALLKMIADWS